MAYSAATIFYQLSRFDQHPASSLVWIITLVFIIGSAIAIMRYYGKQSANLNQAAHQS